MSLDMRFRVSRNRNENSVFVDPVISGMTGAAGVIARRNLGETSFRVPANTKLKLVPPLHNDAGSNDFKRLAVNLSHSRERSLRNRERSKE